ncbi:hypothetical protein B0T25DRAFT_550042 [Lasiosphaeria hispida]|uniref:Uncharacterized protein n=1 Tax=Lasiosphaeria hispida TaxID=260671 RepID=A0AAJ0MD24_9PEZI|nr:hypothetical protein B0T25DRAFT_550042 [Lasiosphaeria hispida]
MIMSCGAWMVVPVQRLSTVGSAAVTVLGAADVPRARMAMAPAMAVLSLVILEESEDDLECSLKLAERGSCDCGCGRRWPSVCQKRR